MTTPARIENDIRDLFDRVEELEALQAPLRVAGSLGDWAVLRKENEDWKAEVNRLLGVVEGLERQGDEAKASNNSWYNKYREVEKKVEDLLAERADLKEDLARERNKLRNVRKFGVTLATRNETFGVGTDLLDVLDGRRTP